MTHDNIGKIISLLANMPGDPKWDAEHRRGLTQFYTIGLASLPDDATNPLLTATTTGCCDQAGRQFRPSVPQILAIWQSIARPMDQSSLTDDLAEIIRLIGKYGPAGSKKRGFEDQWPIIRDYGDPSELALMSRAARSTVAAMGGWVAMCEDNSPSGVWRGQFTALYKAASQNQPTSQLLELRRQFQATQVKSIDTDETNEERTQFEDRNTFRHDASAALRMISGGNSITKGL